MDNTNPKVDFYFRKDQKWQEELAQLRIIALASGLTETLKWGVPSYTLGKSNIVLIHVFKNYCAFLFLKGALLTNDKNILVRQTENVQAARQIRFTQVQEILELAPVLKDLIQEAITIEKAGLKVELKTPAQFNIPEEFQTKLDKISSLKTAFEGLTPGRQRAYLLHFSAPKQSKTREARVEKYIPDILNGKGLND